MQFNQKLKNIDPDQAIKFNSFKAIVKYLNYLILKEKNFSSVKIFIENL